MEDICDIPLLREYDKFLMEEFIKAKIPLQELIVVNKMRIKNKAITLADIISADGTSISYYAWNGLQSNQLRESYDWPKGIPDFTSNQLKIW